MVPVIALSMGSGGLDGSVNVLTVNHITASPHPGVNLPQPPQLVVTVVAHDEGSGSLGDGVIATAVPAMASLLHKADLP